MKRNILLIAMILFFSFVLPSNASTYENEYVKIGLKSPLEPGINYKVSLSSDGFQIGVWNNDFSPIFNINNDRLLAKVDGYYTVKSGNYIKTNASLAAYGPFHIATNKCFYSYDEALYEVEYLRSLDIDAFIYYSQGSFQIWIGQYLSESMAREDVQRFSSYIGSQTDIIGEDKSRIILTDEENNIILMFDKNQNIYLSSLNINGKGIINVENTSYRDYITFSRKEDELIVINSIRLQNYLYGVVPKEMYPSWPLEALKAQAVAAKSYTLYNINKHANDGYNLCDTTHCQVYGGYSSENIMTNRAVDETVGRILMYNDKFVEAIYHSSSGGYTENSENVYSNTIPYLRGIKDEFSLDAPNNSWQFVISKEEIRDRLIENGLDIGYITDIEVLSTSESGRVIELAIRGTKGAQILKKDQIRQVLGAINIKSTLFEIKYNGENKTPLNSDFYVYNFSTASIEKLNNDVCTVLSSDGTMSFDYKSLSKEIIVTDGTNTREITTEFEKNFANSEDKYVFIGKGSGHGVGMSQWGAKKMAELGYDYVQILEYYYTGTKVK